MPARLASPPCVQVREEGQRVYGAKEEEPSREAMDTMEFTAAALKVGGAQPGAAGRSRGGDAAAAARGQRGPAWKACWPLPPSSAQQSLHRR